MEERSHVERLLVNYKTLEHFKKFKKYAIQELSMLEDLEQNIVENNSESPFYGIYDGNLLVARMSLYRIEKKFDRFFDSPQDHLELSKLEVLPPYRNRGYGKSLVEYAKSFHLPIKTKAMRGSNAFWEKLGFKAVPGESENIYVWYPSETNQHHVH